MKRDIANKRTAVYQVVDAERTVLYVGASATPDRRFQAHMRGGRFPGGCSYRVVRWFDTRREALDKESSLISALQPTLNKMGRHGFSCRTKRWDRGLACRLIEEGHEVSEIALACDVDRNTITYNLYDRLKARNFNRKE